MIRLTGERKRSQIDQQNIYEEGRGGAGMGEEEVRVMEAGGEK